MTMTYERYKELVPAETLEYTNKVLKYLNEYVVQDWSLYFNRGDSSTLVNKKSRAFLIFLYSFSQIKKHKEFIDSQLLSNRVKLSSTIEDVNYPRLFALFSEFFLVSRFEEEYINLSPTRLVLEECKRFNNIVESSSSWKKQLFDGERTLNSFIENLCEYHDKEEYAYSLGEREVAYSGLSKNVVSYLDRASIIMKDLITNYSNNSVIKSIPEDCVPLALLLAAAYYEDVEKDEYDLTKQTSLLELLEEKGIVLRQGEEATLLKYVPERLEREPDIRTVNYFFRKYLEQGIYALKERNSVTVPGIIENVLCDGLNDTDILQRVIPLQYQGEFAGLENEVNREYRITERIKELDYTSPLLSDTNYSTKHFLMISTKIYSIIKRKMNGDDYNKDVLRGDDDADTLSLFLASFFMELKGIDVTAFYERHGITLEKILDFLGINITLEEINKTPLNKKLLMDKFNRFVVGGVNNGYKLSDIRPNNICDNLCDRGFNKSIIMEEIYNSLSNGEIVGSDFLNRVKTEIYEIREKEKAIEREKEEEVRKKRFSALFDGADDETVRFLQRLSKIYSRLEKSFNHPVTQSIFLALGNTGPEDYVWLALRSNGYSVENYLDSDFNGFDREFKSFVADNKGKDPAELNVDLLYCFFKDFIFDRSTGKRRNIYEMVRQIPSFCNETLLNVLYIKQNIKEDIFLNIEEEVEAEKQSRIERINESKCYNLFHPIHGYSSLFEDSIKIIEYLRAIHFDKIPEEDLPDFSILLGLLIPSYYRDESRKKHFEANGITFEKVCTLYGIDAKELKDFSPKVKFYKHLKDYEKYFEGLDESKENNISIYLRRFFHSNHALEAVVKRLNEESCVHQISIERLEVEVISDKPFLDTLSISQKREVLKNQKVEQLDHNNWPSILTYGSSILEHSQAIIDEFARLENESVSEGKLERVYKNLARVCHVDVSSDKSSKSILAAKINKSITSRLTFAKGLHIRNKKMNINSDDIAELNRSIGIAIETLSDEIAAYYELHEYIDIFRDKNLEYYKNAHVSIEELKEKEKTYDSSDKTLAKAQMTQTKTNSLLTTIERLAGVNELTKAYIVSVNNAIRKNKNDISALMVAQNVLIPLVRRYSSKPDVPREDLLVSNSVVRLINGILSRDESYINASLKLLEHSSLPSGDISKIKGQLVNSSDESGIDMTEPTGSGMLGPRSDGTFPEIIPTATVSKDANGSGPKLIFTHNN